MAIRTKCPHCKKTLKAQDSYLHKTIKCPACSKKFEVLTLEEFEADEKAKREAPKIIRKKRKFLKTPLHLSDRPDKKKLKSLGKRIKNRDRLPRRRSSSSGEFTLVGIGIKKARIYVAAVLARHGYKVKWKNKNQLSVKKGLLDNKIIVHIKPRTEDVTWVTVNHPYLENLNYDRYNPKKYDLFKEWGHDTASIEYGEILNTLENAFIKDGYSQEED